MLLFNKYNNYLTIKSNRNDENYDEMNDDLEMMMMEELKML